MELFDYEIILLNITFLLLKMVIFLKFKKIIIFLKGINRSFKIISEKGFAPSKENNCLYYFEVKIIPEIEEECG